MAVPSRNSVELPSVTLTKHGIRDFHFISRQKTFNIHKQTGNEKNKLIIAWFLIHDKLDVSMSLFPLLESYFCHHQQRQCAEVSCYPLISWIDFLFKIDTNFWFQLLCHLSLFHYLFSTGCDRILPYIYKSLAYKIVIYEALD